MLDFICMDFALLWAKGSKRILKRNENICLYRETNQRPLIFKLVASKYSATLTVNDLLLELLHFEITINSCWNACMKLNFVGCLLELTVRQNMHFYNTDSIYYYWQNCWTNQTINNLCLHCHSMTGCLIIFHFRYYTTKKWVSTNQDRV